MNTDARRAAIANRNAPKWSVGTVIRPDAGAKLYNAIRIENNQVIECDRTPTHSRLKAQLLVDELNRGFDFEKRLSNFRCASD